MRHLGSPSPSATVNSEGKLSHTILAQRDLPLSIDLSSFQIPDGWELVQRDKKATSDYLRLIPLTLKTNTEQIDELVELLIVKCPDGRITDHEQFMRATYLKILGSIRNPRVRIELNFIGERNGVSSHECFFSKIGKNSATEKWGILIWFFLEGHAVVGLSLTRRPEELDSRRELLGDFIEGIVFTHPQS